jgi:hypothetical protein
MKIKNRFFETWSEWTAGRERVVRQLLDMNYFEVEYVLKQLSQSKAEVYNAKGDFAGYKKQYIDLFVNTIWGRTFIKQHKETI